MNKNNNDSNNTLIEYLTGSIITKSIFCNIIPSKSEEIANKFIVNIPILILLQQCRHKIFIRDELDPSKGKIRVENRVYLMELSCKNIIK